MCAIETSALVAQVLTRWIGGDIHGLRVLSSRDMHVGMLCFYSLQIMRKNPQDWDKWSSGFRVRIHGDI